MCNSLIIYTSVHAIRADFTCGEGQTGGVRAGCRASRFKERAFYSPHSLLETGSRPSSPPPESQQEHAPWQQFKGKLHSALAPMALSADLCRRELLTAAGSAADKWMTAAPSIFTTAASSPGAQTEGPVWHLRSRWIGTNFWSQIVLYHLI